MKRSCFLAVAAFLGITLVVPARQTHAQSCPSTCRSLRCSYGGEPCPPTTELIHSYIQTATPSQGAIAGARKSAVVLFRKPSDNHLFCSGTLITSDTVLTAAHCFDDFDLETQIGFAYEEQCDGTQLPGIWHAVNPLRSDGVNDGGVIERGSSAHDYMLVRVAGNPQIAPTPIRAYVPPLGSATTMIGHPRVQAPPDNYLPRPMQAGGDTVRRWQHLPGYDYFPGFHGLLYVRFGIVARLGSSGAGVLDAAGNLFGVNVRFHEVCSEGNGAVSLEQLAHVSPFIRARSMPAHLFVLPWVPPTARISVSCGSSPESQCTRISDGVNQDTQLGAEGCSVACQPGATVTVNCSIPPGGRVAGSVIWYKTNVVTPGETWAKDGATQSLSCAGDPYDCTRQIIADKPVVAYCVYDEE